MNDIEVDFTIPQEDIDVDITTTDDYDLKIFAIKGDKGDTGLQGERGLQGEKGDTGDTGATGETGNGIVNIRKTSTSGLVDTYTIAYTNGSTDTFNITNGKDGEVTQEYVDNAISETIGSINSVLATLTSVGE